VLCPVFVDSRFDGGDIDDALRSSNSRKCRCVRELSVLLKGSDDLYDQLDALEVCGMEVGVMCVCVCVVCVCVDVLMTYQSEVL